MVSRSQSNSRPTLLSFLIAVVVAAVLSVAFAQATVAAAKQKTFPSTETAINAAVKAISSNNRNELLAIFGPAGKQVLSSGDAVADKQARVKFLQAYDQKHSLVAGGGGKMLILGALEWPWPIPLVRKGSAWYFDTNKGKQEILNRRIGRNELDTIQVCLAIGDAQREYCMSE